MIERQRWEEMAHWFFYSTEKDQTVTGRDQIFALGLTNAQ
ncbi:hypothetical protein LEMLEM_LOCUS417 [Lemmus lemmus]